MFDIAARLEQAGFGTQQQFLDGGNSGRQPWWPISIRRRRAWRATCSRIPIILRPKATPEQITDGHGEALQAGGSSRWD